MISAAKSSATGTIAAVAADPAGGQVLLMAQPQEPERADPVLKAGTLTVPSFTHAGDEVWVVQNGATKPEVYRISASGNPSRDRVGSDALAGKGPVTALALSPDGVRIAIVAGERLYLGVVAPVPADAPAATATTGPVPSPDPAADTTAAPEPAGNHQPHPAAIRTWCTSGR